MTPRTRYGYTIVELMMSLAVLAIGASGIIAMQKVTVASNQHAKNLAVATRISEAWADALAADASLWNSTTDLTSETAWLRNTPTNGNWIRPAWVDARQFGPAFSALGDPVQTTSLAQFCTDIRLTWLHPADPPGSGLIRAEIRVFWKREGAVMTNVVSDICAAANTPAQVTANSDGYRFVMLTTAVSEQVAP